jgi:hypothetical protein
MIEEGLIVLAVGYRLSAIGSLTVGCRLSAVGFFR